MLIIVLKGHIASEKGRSRGMSYCGHGIIAKYRGQKLPSPTSRAQQTLSPASVSWLFPFSSLTLLFRRCLLLQPPRQFSGRQLIRRSHLLRRPAATVGRRDRGPILLLSPSLSHALQLEVLLILPADFGAEVGIVVPGAALGGKGEVGGRREVLVEAGGERRR